MKIDDINDERPIFPLPHYVKHVMEHEKYGHIIGNVTAVDGDIVSFINLLRYYAVFLLPEQKFDINVSIIFQMLFFVSLQNQTFLFAVGVLSLILSIQWTLFKYIIILHFS